MEQDSATLLGAEVQIGQEFGPPSADHSIDVSESAGLDTGGYAYAGTPWSDPADLWAAGADTQSPIPIDAEGDASLPHVHSKMLLGDGEDGEDEAENFIQEDESCGDDDAFDLEWALANVGNGRRNGSNNRSRPDSAVHGRRNVDINFPHPPCPTMNAFRVPIDGLDPEEAAELRVNSIWPSFVVAYHRIVSSKYAVGSSKMLLQYLQRGYPEYCVEAILNAVKSVTKMRSAIGRAHGGRKPAYADGEEPSRLSASDSAPVRLIVMGNYCAELLWTAGRYEEAKKILNKMEVLTSVYSAEVEHKRVLRVWTLCNMAILHAEKGLPVAAFDFISTALDEALRHKDPAASLVVSSVRAAFLCRTSHFDRACEDVAYARFVLAEIDDEAPLGPSPNAVVNHLNVSNLFNGALACMCSPQARVADARRMAEAAWSQVLASGDSTQAAVEADLRKRCLRLRDALAQQEGARVAGSRHDVFRDYLNAVRAASMGPLWSQERLTIKVNKLPAPASKQPTDGCRGAAPARESVGAGEPHPSTSTSAAAPPPHELLRAAPRDIFSLLRVQERPKSSTWMRRRQSRPASAPPARAGSPGDEVVECGAPPERLDSHDASDVWEQLRHAASQVALDPRARPPPVECAGASTDAKVSGAPLLQTAMAASDPSLSVAEASQRFIDGLHQLRPASRAVGTGSSAHSRHGPPLPASSWRPGISMPRGLSEANGADAQHARHVRTRWLLHSPVVVCAVSPAVEEFLVAAESLFEADEVAACLAQLERLVQGLASGKVREVLGDSLPHHVLICLCHLCNKLAVRCFLKRRSDDGLVFFGTALVFAGRIGMQEQGLAGADEELEELCGWRAEERQGLQCLLKAWTLDQLAFSYLFVGENEAALAALAACDKACDDAALASPDPLAEAAAGGSMQRLVVGGVAAASQELKVVAGIHRMQVELVAGQPLASLQMGLEMLQHLRSRLGGDERASSRAASAGTAGSSGDVHGRQDDDLSRAKFTLFESTIGDGFRRGASGSGREAEEAGGAALEGDAMSPHESRLVGRLESQRLGGLGDAGACEDGGCAGEGGGRVEAGPIKQRVLNVGEEAEVCEVLARKPFDCLGGWQVHMGALDAAAATRLQGDAEKAETRGGDNELHGGKSSVWMALYLVEVAANAIPGAAAKGLDEHFTGENKKADAGGGLAPPAVHSLEYVTAHVSHATAAASAALGRVKDALSLLTYAQEVGAQAQGARADGLFARRRGRANGDKQNASSAPRKIRTRLLSPAFTGISAHASASCAGRKECGRPGSGWDLTAGPSCLAKLVEQGKAFLEFTMRNAEEVLLDQQDPWSVQMAANAGRSWRPPSSADAVKSAATTRPSSALSRPPSAKAGSKDSMAPHGAAGRLRVRPWSAAAAAAGADGLGARLHQTDKQLSGIRLEGGRLSASRSKLGARIRPASAIGLSREAASRGAGSGGESGNRKPVCGTAREREAAGHQLDESSDSVSGPERHSVEPLERGSAVPSRAALVAVSGLASDYGVKKREQASNRRPRSAMMMTRSTAGEIASGTGEPSSGSALHKPWFGSRSRHVHATAGIPTCAGSITKGGTGGVGAAVAPPLYHEACTRHAMRMEAAGVRAPRPRPASALR